MPLSFVLPCLDPIKLASCCSNIEKVSLLFFCIYLSGCLYVSGGAILEDGDGIELVQKYDSKMGEWTEVAGMLIPRSGSAACLLGNLNFNSPWHTKSANLSSQKFWPKILWKYVVHKKWSNWLISCVNDCSKVILGTLESKYFPNRWLHLCYWRLARVHWKYQQSWTLWHPEKYLEFCQSHDWTAL